jgi:HEPN domain-containing protein
MKIPARKREEAMESDFLAEARRWLALAQRDLDTAAANLGIGIFHAARFFCQQAVEKALKAVLLLRTRRCPPRLHALEQLLDEVGGPQEFRPELVRLTQDYLLTRYPDVEPVEPSRRHDREDAERGLKAAKELLAWAEGQVEHPHAG